MSLVLDRMPALPRVPAFAGRKAILRASLVGVGWTLIVASPFIGAIPGPGGIPVFIGGLVLVLRNSAGSRRLFVKLQHRFPKVFSPVRKLLRRDAKVVPESWKRFFRRLKGQPA